MVGPTLCPILHRALDLGGHTHGAGCGHERVAHGDHEDYLVEDELHHVSSSCCSKQCSQGPVVVSHGRLSTLKLRRPMHTTPLHLEALLPAPQRAAASHATPTQAAAVGVPVAAAGQLQTTRIFAAGICCPMETPLVHSVLGGMPGVHSMDVSVMAQTVVVRHDPALTSPAALVAALNSAMLEASLTIPRKQAKVRGRWLPPWHVLAGAALLLLSLLHYLAGPTDTPGLENLKYLSLGAVALCLPRIALRAALALRRWVMDVHLLVTLAAAGAIALADYAEAAAVVVLFAVAEHWERCSTDKARDAVAAVLMLRPDSAKLASSGELVSVDQVPLGTEVLVSPGESVPLDGVVAAGESAVDESLLTGESAAVSRGPGSVVHAGTLNVGSAVLLVKTTSAAGDTAVARMAALVEKAASQQSPAEALVAKFARIYTPIILVACIILAFLPWAFVTGDKRRDWVYLSLQVLVTACPCALVLSTPATVVCALARAAQRGVLIKSGAALEALRRVSVVTFDKTGTLTKGSFQVVACQAHNGWSRPELLRLLGSLERGSSHPLAAAVLGYAAAQGVACDAQVESTEAVPGSGLTALVDGRRVVAGTASLLSLNAGVEGPQVAAAQQAVEAEGATACFVAVDGQFAGWLSARDVVRPEAAEAVAMLDRMHCQACMLTGDASAAAAGVGAATGIPPQRVHARLLPHEKQAKVAEYKEGPSQPRSSCCHGLLPAAACCLGRGGGSSSGTSTRRRKAARVWVAHVGDGVNDAPALAAADAGIAMGVAGSAAALEAGSVALFTNDVRSVPAALMLARAAGVTIWQNITFAVITKIAVLVPAAMGRFTLWGAVLMDVGSALLVVGNALRLLKWRWPVDTPTGSRKHAKQGDCCSSGHCTAAKQGPSHTHSHAHSAEGACCKPHTHSQKHAHGNGSACCAAHVPKASKSQCCDAKAGAGSQVPASDGGGDAQCCLKSQPAPAAAACCPAPHPATCASSNGGGVHDGHAHTHVHAHADHKQPSQHGSPAGASTCCGGHAAHDTSTSIGMPASSSHGLTHAHAHSHTKEEQHGSSCCGAGSAAATGCGGSSQAAQTHSHSHAASHQHGSACCGGQSPLAGDAGSTAVHSHTHQRHADVASGSGGPGLERRHAHSHGGTCCGHSHAAAANSQ